MKKTASIISIIIGLLCVATVITSMIKTTSKSAFDMPILSMILGAEEVNEGRRQLENDIEAFEEICEDASEDELDEIEDEFGVTYDKLIEEFKEPSLNTLIKYSSFKKLGIDAELLQAFKIFRAILIAYALFIALFSLLGALIRKSVFTILANIFCPVFFICFVGWGFFALFIILSILHVVFVSIARSKPAAPMTAYHM